MLPQPMRAGIPLPHKLRREALVRAHSYLPGGPPVPPDVRAGRADGKKRHCIDPTRADEYRLVTPVAGGLLLEAADDLFAE